MSLDARQTEATVAAALAVSSFLGSLGAQDSAVRVVQALESEGLAPAEWVATLEDLLACGEWDLSLIHI